MVYLMESVTLITSPVKLDSFLICKSTIGKAVILGISSLLLDVLVSFSVLFTMTTLEIVPAEMT